MCPPGHLPVRPSHPPQGSFGSAPQASLPAFILRPGHSRLSSPASTIVLGHRSQNCLSKSSSELLNSSAIHRPKLGQTPEPSLKMTLQIHPKHILSWILKLKHYLLEKPSIEQPKKRFTHHKHFRFAIHFQNTNLLCNFCCCLKQKKKEATIFVLCSMIIK